MTGPTPGLGGSFPKCQFCGYMHPPVSDGKCAMAASNPPEPKTPEDFAVIEIEKFLNNMRIQLKVKLIQLKLKDSKNLFLFLSTELNKLMENYKE